jgi:molybdopterin-binding protein
MLRVSVETYGGGPMDASAWPDPRAASAWSRSPSLPMLDERRKASTDRPIVAQSARNRFPGIVTRIERDRVAAVVEVLAGPHRLVSLMTAEAVDDLDLKVGDEAVGVVKATNVIIEIPSSREPRG